MIERVVPSDRTWMDKDVSVVKAADVPYDAQFYARIGDGSRRSAAILLRIVFDLVRPHSVVDVGCGVGSWAAVALDLGGAEVLGIDGDYVDRGQLQIPHACFMPCDLRNPLRLERGFDLAISLEVAEHLPAECAETFVESLVRLAPVVLFSAAVPGQGGDHHVNEQWPAYWAELFARYDFEAVDCVRPRVWNDEQIGFWYRQNTILYARRDYLTRHPELRSIGARGQPLPLVHPLLLASYAGVPQPATWGLRRAIAKLPGLLVASVQRRVLAAIRCIGGGTVTARPGTETNAPHLVGVRLPRVSVLMPAHNAVRHIAGSVKSILAQTSQDFEFVIVDDASTDGTEQYLQSLRDPRIRVIRNDVNLGIASSLNRGLALCRGEYVARQDADDLSMPTRLERQVAILDSMPKVGLVGTAATLIDAEGNVVGRSCHSSGADVDVRWKMFFLNPFPHTGVMARRSLMAGGYSDAREVSVSEDHELWSRIARDHQFAFLPEDLVQYRQHAASVSRTGDARQLQEILGVAFREACMLVGAATPRKLFDDFLAVFRGGGRPVILSDEEVGAAAQFASRLLSAHCARAGGGRVRAWRYCTKVRIRWAGHLVRLVLHEPRGLRWRARVAALVPQLLLARFLHPQPGAMALRAAG